MKNEQTILEIENLGVSFHFDGKPAMVIRDVSFSVKKNEILGIVGESGSGKSVTAKTILRLIPDPPGHIEHGRVMFKGDDVLKMNQRDLCRLRGDRISMIFQEPMTSLNPLFTCGSQIAEAIMTHQHVPKKEAKARAIDLLEKVGIPMAEKRYHAYPHELSGGMRQRVMIAIALSCAPELLIADEPTTALDPTIQSQILQLMKQLQKDNGMSVMLITHDLGVVAETCDRVIVLYGGMIMEEANVRDLFKHPLHPYTMGLMKAIPHVHKNVDRLYTIRDNVPHFTEMPKGCPFHTRCPFAVDACMQERPPFVRREDGHGTACIRYAEIEKGELSL